MTEQLFTYGRKALKYFGFIKDSPITEIYNGRDIIVIKLHQELIVNKRNEHMVKTYELAINAINMTDDPKLRLTFIWYLITGLVKDDVYDTLNSDEDLESKLDVMNSYLEMCESHKKMVERGREYIELLKENKAKSKSKSEDD